MTRNEFLSKLLMVPAIIGMLPAVVDEEQSFIGLDDQVEFKPYIHTVEHIDEPYGCLNFDDLLCIVEDKDDTFTVYAKGQVPKLLERLGLLTPLPPYPKTFDISSYMDNKTAIQVLKDGKWN